jgi:hypothetical protein
MSTHAPVRQRRRGLTSTCASGLTASAQLESLTASAQLKSLPAPSPRWCIQKDLAWDPVSCLDPVPSLAAAVSQRTDAPPRAAAQLGRPGERRPPCERGAQSIPLACSCSPHAPLCAKRTPAVGRAAGRVRTHAARSPPMELGPIRSSGPATHTTLIARIVAMALAAQRCSHTAARASSRAAQAVGPVRAAIRIGSSRFVRPVQRQHAPSPLQLARQHRGASTLPLARRCVQARALVAA